MRQGLLAIAAGLLLFVLLASASSLWSRPMTWWRRAAGSAVEEGFAVTDGGEAPLGDTLASKQGVVARRLAERAAPRLTPEEGGAAAHNEGGEVQAATAEAASKLAPHREAGPLHPVPGEETVLITTPDAKPAGPSHRSGWGSAGGVDVGAPPKGAPAPVPV